MCLNVNDKICNDNLIFNGQPIAIVDDFRYLSSYKGSTNQAIRAKNWPHLDSICQTQTHSDIAQSNGEV